MSESGPQSIAFVKQQGGFWPAASIVLQHLAAAGVETHVFEDGDPAALETGLWLLLRGSAGWHPRTMRLIPSRPPAERPRALLWLTEPLPPPASSGLAPSRRSHRDLAKLALRDVRANDQRTNLGRTLDFVATVPRCIVAASTVAKVETLAEHGVPSTFVPLGALPVDDDLSSVPRDIDVLFLGDPAVPHRRTALRRLRRAGVDVVARGAWSRERGLWGEERDDVLRRTKLLLNVSRHPGNAADHRLALGAAFGAVVVSEPMVGPDPYVAGTHFEEAPVAALPELMSALLDDRERRDRLAAAAAEVAREHSAVASVSRLIALMAAFDAAGETR